MNNLVIIASVGVLLVCTHYAAYVLGKVTVRLDHIAEQTAEIAETVEGWSS